jgi:FAM192A/Fyv6, N-terminal domain
LVELKASRGGRVEDGVIAPEKPLVEVLREAKEKKEEAFQEQWKLMKQGGVLSLICAAFSGLITQ